MPVKSIRPKPLHRRTCDFRLGHNNGKDVLPILLPPSNVILRPLWSFISSIRSPENGYGQRPFLNVPIEPFAPNFVRPLPLAVKLEQRSLFIYKFSASIRTGPKTLGGKSPTTSLLLCGNFTLREGYNIKKTLPTMQLAKRTSNFSMTFACIADCGCCGRVGPVPQHRHI